MLKKCMAIFLALIFIITPLNLKAENYINKITTNVNGYEITSPDKKVFSTNSGNIVLNGKAVKDSKITVRVYCARNIERNKYNLANLPNDNIYTLYSEINLESGNFGLFQSPINLANGINKVVIDFNREGVEPIELIVYFYRTINMAI